MNPRNYKVRTVGKFEGLEECLDSIGSSVSGSTTDITDALKTLNDTVSDAAGVLASVRDDILAISGKLDTIVGYLTPEYTFTIVPTPDSADVTINGEDTRSVTVKEGTDVEWTVSAYGYVTQSGTVSVGADMTLEVALEVARQYTFSISVDQTEAEVYINGEKRQSVTEYEGTEINYEVVLDGFYTEAGIITLEGDTSKEFTMVPEPFTFIYNYDGEEDPSISTDGTAKSDNASLFVTDGACEVTVNDVKVDVPSNETVYLGQYMAVGENTVGIAPKEGKISSSRRTMSATGTYRKNIPRIITWGGYGFDDCSYLMANASTLVSFPKFTVGFGDVTSLSRTFYNCLALETIPEGMLDRCGNLTSATYLFDYSPVKSIPENLFARNTKITNFSYAFCAQRETPTIVSESAYDTVDIDGETVKIHLYERGNYPDIYTAPTSYTQCYRYQNDMTDYNDIPSGWV